MSIRRAFLILALLIWSALGHASPTAGNAGAVVIPAGTQTLRVDRDVELLFEKPGEHLTRERVLQADMAQRWSVYPHKTINLPGVRDPVWVRFTVRNATPTEEWVLGIDWPLFDEVQFQQYDPSTQVWTDLQRAGLKHPELMQALKDRAPNFPVNVESGRSTMILLKVQTQNTLTLPLELWQPQAWLAERYNFGVAMGLLFGILGVMFFYNLSLYIFTRDSSFRTYSVYLLSIVAYEMSVTGFGPLFVWPGNEWLNQRGYEFFAACSFLAATVFFRQFLQLKRAARHLNRMNQGFVALFAILAVLTLFPTPLAVVVALAFGGIVVGFGGIYTAGYLVWQGNVLARYFVIAWFTIIVATFVVMLAVVGVVDGGRWLKYAQPVGFVLETVLLSIALAARINRERRTREAAQRKSVELARNVEQEREEKLRAQEHALNLQLKANEELELRVLDRTAELKRTMENLELANRELAKLSVTDGLTKVHNRRYFDEVMKKEFDRSARTGSPLTLMLVDIDYFKKINDSAGHLAGDECLKLVAGALQGCVGRSSDLVARYGGEEFGIVLPGTDGTHAMELAERIRRAVEEIEFIYRGRRVPISISIGVVARVVDPSRSVSEFITDADKALYAAKGAGRNRAILAAAA